MGAGPVNGNGHDLENDLWDLLRYDYGACCMDEDEDVQHVVAGVISLLYKRGILQDEPYLSIQIGKKGRNVVTISVHRSLFEGFHVLASLWGYIKQLRTFLEVRLQTRG